VLNRGLWQMPALRFELTRPNPLRRSAALHPSATASDKVPMSDRKNPRFARMISDYLRKRAAHSLPPRDVERLRGYLLGKLRLSEKLPAKGSGFDWDRIALETGVEVELLARVKDNLRPLLGALRREIAQAPARRNVPTSRTPRSKPTRNGAQPPAPLTSKTAVEPFPEPAFDVWDEPATFHEALALHMRRHSDTSLKLCRGILKAGETLEVSTILAWRRGAKSPRSVASLEFLTRIERRYRLPFGYFKAKLPHRARAATGHAPAGISPAELRRLAWHLPDDFGDRSKAEQEEILEWVRRVVISGSTEYRRYQANAMKLRYAVRFPALQAKRPSRLVQPEEEAPATIDGDPELLSGVVKAPPQLAAEMADLIRFKTSTLTALGYQRRGVWGDETAAQKIEHLGLMFGALAASSRGAVRGRNVPLRHLTFGLLVFPAVWDWYVQWRESRRGLYTAWEVDMLGVAAALTGAQTGWITQTPGLAAQLQPIPDLVTASEIEQAQANWSAACAAAHAHALVRAKEIQRVARVHRDPFEPILSVLEAESPVGEYRRIADEIVRLMPAKGRYSKSRAEAVRSFLLIRFGLHLGLRQRNLRELLVCPRGGAARSERQLEELRRGELRWSDRDQGWEVLIPAVAFKNANSSFFGGRPFRLILPNLGGLYEYLEEWLTQHRQALLGRARDPGTFFVKTAKSSSANAAYDQNTFYEAWRLTIQRYGIHNPYTGRGAIKGLLPHGPHNVRDVLATHILKQTGSYEQASYAIQDTPDMVAKHYGRFLPQDKAALAAQILNQVWAA
jgi:hypothetical protein